MILEATAKSIDSGQYAQADQGRHFFPQVSFQDRSNTVLFDTELIKCRFDRDSL